MKKFLEYGTATIGDARLSIFATEDFKYHVYDSTAQVDLVFDSFDRLNDFFKRFFGLQLESDYKLVPCAAEYGTPIMLMARAAHKTDSE